MLDLDLYVVGLYGFSNLECSMNNYISKQAVE